MKARVKKLMGKRVLVLNDGDDKEVFTVKDCIVATVGIVTFMLLLGMAGHAECASAI